MNSTPDRASARTQPRPSSETTSSLGAGARASVPPGPAAPRRDLAGSPAQGAEWDPSLWTASSAAAGTEPRRKQPVDQFVARLVAARHLRAHLRARRAPRYRAERGDRV